MRGEMSWCSDEWRVEEVLQVEVGRDDPVTGVLSRPLGGRNCQN